MVSKVPAVGLVALCLVAVCAGQSNSDQLAVQQTFSQMGVKVDAVAQVAGPVAQSMLSEISSNIAAIPDPYWQIEWGSQQSNWDAMVNYANIAVMRITQILPSIPESSGQSWGSVFPRDDLKEVAIDICEMVEGLLPKAEAKFGVKLNIPFASQCDHLKPAEAPVAARSIALAPAPGPGYARRLLSV